MGYREGPGWALIQILLVEVIRLEMWSYKMSHTWKYDFYLDNVAMSSCMYSKQAAGQAVVS